MYKLVKNSVIFVVMLSLLLVVSSDVSAKKNHRHNNTTHIGFGGITIDDINIDYDKKDLLTVTNTYEETSFSIDKKYNLYINDEFVETTPDQRKLTKEMYRTIDLIIEEAKEIGWDGAKIGVDGAKLGLNAVLCVLKLLSPDYDADDLKAEIEKKAEKIEKKAEKIELRAENIEDMARELEEISDRMRKNIPELKELSWF